jgi:hypothetical protein
MLDDDDPDMSMQSGPLLPFYPMQVARVEAIKSFQEALLQSRTMVSVAGRARVGNSEKSKQG